MSNETLSKEAASLFEGKNFAFVATLMADGSPQITPVWVDLEQDNNTIIVNTAKGRVKQKNVSRDPRVAVSVVDHANPYNMVSVMGRVEEQTTQGADEHIDSMAKKYLGVEKYPFRSPTEQRVILKIKPEKVFHVKPR